MRILHLPTNPADQAGIVVREMRRAGHDAELWHFGAPPFGFQADRIIPIGDSDPTAIWPHVLEAIDRFDVFHFHSARSFFPYGWQAFPLFWDLPLLRMLGKTIVFTFHGSECRIPEIHARHNPFSSLFFERYTPDVDRMRKTQALISTYADHLVVVSAELLPHVPGARVVRRAFSLADFDEQPPAQRDVPVVIHCPSRRSLKDTDRIVDAMESLRSEGVAFDFQVHEGIPHDEVLKKVRDADVVVDQITMGDLGVLSVEAMAANRVAVAYMTEPVQKASPKHPVYVADPAGFLGQMRELITRRDLRMQHAERGRAYVAETFDAPLIAGQLLSMYAEPKKRQPWRMFPDWMTVASARRIEQMEERLREQTDQGRALRTENAWMKRRIADLERRLVAARPWSPAAVAPVLRRRIGRLLRKR